MKKLILIAIAFVSLQGMAQKRERSHKQDIKKERHFKDMSPEDLAQLKTKKMTLKLDLDEVQKQKVYDLVLTQVKARKSKYASNGEKKERKDLSKEERLKKVNENLDAKIAFKKEMKSILNKEQYEKFERSFNKQRKQNKNKMKQGFRR